MISKASHITSLLISSQSNSNIHPIICDVTSKPHLQAAVDEITKKSSHVDVLVCNAGMAPPTPKPQPTETSSISEVRNYFFSTLSTEDHATVLNLNNTAVMVTTFAFLELLDAANKRNHVEGTGRVRSQVIAVGSAGAFFRRGSDFVYNASKAATTHLIKQMATFLVPWDIRCNIIEPGCKLQISFLFHGAEELTIVKGFFHKSQPISPSSLRKTEG